MTYATLLNKENIESGYLCVLRPAKIISSWTLLSGTTYYASISDHVIGVTANGVALTEDTSSPPASSKFYYDYNNGIIYINHNPTGETIVVTFELYYGTVSKHFYRIPTDSSSRVVFWDGLLIKTPSFRQSITNNYFGFMESNSSSIEIGNPDSAFEPLIYSTSFANKEIHIYHWLDILTTANVKLIAKAMMKNVDYTTKSITIPILDRVDEFSKEFRGSFYYASTFANLDPNFEGRPIRNVYGKVFEAFLVNLDYEADNPTTSTNRKWAVREGSTNSVQHTVGNGSTTTLTYLDSVNGYNSGDAVKFTKALVEYKIITGVDRINKTISHSALTAAAVSSDTVERPTAQVYIEKEGVIYRPLYDRDYTEGNEGGLVRITFTASMESNLSIATLTVNDKVYADIYGKDNAISDIWTGANSSTYDCLTNPIVILYDIIKNYVKDSNINTSNFNTLATTFSTYELGFSLPEKVEENFPTYKDILTTIFTSCLLKFFLDTNNNWKLEYVSVLPTADISIEEDEILDSSYTFNYDDIVSEVIVEYKFKEYSNIAETASQVSTKAIYLHEVSNQKIFRTYLLNNANTVATTLKNLYGDRQGRLDISVKNRFFNTFIGDTISVSLEKIPGFTYTGALNTRKFDIIEINKGLREINMTLNDQKGIEEA